MPERLEITVKYRGKKADQLTSADDGLASTILRKDLVKLKAHLPSQRTLRHIGATFCFSWILESSPGDKRSTGHESVLRRWQKLSNDNEPELREIRQSLSIESITVVTSAIDSPEAAPSASKTLPSRPEPYRSQAPPLSNLPDKPPRPSKANSSNLLYHSEHWGWGPSSTFTTPGSKSKSHDRIWTRGEDRSSSGDQQASRKRAGSPLMKMGAGNKRRPDTSTEMLRTLSGSLRNAGEQRDRNGPSAETNSPSHQPQPVQGQPSELQCTTVGDPRNADSIVRVKSEPSPEPQLQPPPQHVPLLSHPAPNPPTSRNITPVERLTRELRDTRRNIIASQAREKDILKRLGEFNALPKDTMTAREATALEDLEALLRMSDEDVQRERKRRLRAEQLLREVERECRAPFVVPALLQAFLSITELTE